MRRLLLLLTGLLISLAPEAKETLSYLYIQGDKQTPFYVKMEEEMQPRYGKNYSIIPQLAPGPLHIEILFQQNVYPAQKFTVLIPDGGSRGFLLVKKEDSFALYDLQQGFYLMSGNSEADDHLPVVGTPVIEPPIVETREEQPVVTKIDEEIPKVVKPTKEKIKVS